MRSQDDYRSHNVPLREDKLSYASPQLHKWGAIEAITQVGKTNPGTDTWPNGQDFDGGSVNPPGHDK